MQQAGVCFRGANGEDEILGAVVLLLGRHPMGTQRTNHEYAVLKRDHSVLFRPFREQKQSMLKQTVFSEIRLFLMAVEKKESEH